MARPKRARVAILPDNAYSQVHVEHWKPNLFISASGTHSKQFVAEFPCLFKGFVTESALETFVFKAAITTSALLRIAAIMREKNFAVARKFPVQSEFHKLKFSGHASSAKILIA